MAKLSAAARKKLPASTFAGPDRSFPMPDKSHARNALARSKFASPKTKSRIKRKAQHMGIKVKGLHDGGDVGGPTNPDLLPSTSVRQIIAKKPKGKF